MPITMNLDPSVNPESDSSRYEWAEHLIWMEGGAPVEPRREATRAVYGVLLSFAVAGLAFAASRYAGRFFDPILLSMLFGLVLGNAITGDRFLHGTSLVVKRLLPMGIVLLGARMNVLDALQIGLPGLLISFGVVFLSIGLLFGCRKWIGLDRESGLLLGVGTGICGGTAIVAIAPLIHARERTVILGVGIVTLVGLVAMLLLPVLGRALDLSQTQFGMLAGLTIHQTPQAIAAGFAYGDEAGQVATLAKLTRVCLLAPVAVAIGWLIQRQPREAAAAPSASTPKAWYRLIPLFALGFLAMAALRSAGLLPEVALHWGVRKATFDFDTASLLKTLSSLLLATAMVAIGFQTRFAHFRAVGARPLIAAFLATILICAVVTLATLAWIR